MEATRRKAVVVCLVVLVMMAGGVSIVILRFFFFNYLRVPQDGMFPSIPAGSPLISRRHPYKSVTDVKRGDVVIFNRAVNGQVHKYIWRVVALPGDKIEVSDDSVAINARTLKHEQVRKEGNFLIVREWNGEASYEIAFDQSVSDAQRPRASLTIPQNHLFVLGDNRYNAEDSTYIGPIPFESIVEKKIF